MITDDLLFRFLSQETSSKENRAVQEWLSTHPENVSRLNALQSMYESADPATTRNEALTTWKSLENKLEPIKIMAPTRPALPFRLARIAAILIVLVGSWLLLQRQMDTHVIRNNEPVTKAILLPDGSHVDLGPGSKLIYTGSFDKGNRLIKMSGEACFDVKTDTEHPFIVMAGSARIKVTGTKFVVNATSGNKEVEVSVKSGHVLFYNSDKLDENAFRMGLVAGEKGIFYPDQNRMDKTLDSYSQSTP